MTTILAALDNSTTARPVLATAMSFADLFHGTVQALHVGEDEAGTDHVERTAASAHLPLEILEGDPVQVIVTRLARPAIVMGVLGTRRVGNQAHPAGRTAISIATLTTKPLTVVPPDSRSSGPAVGGRVLLPLDGTSESTAAVRRAAGLLIAAGVDLIGLHVFGAETWPCFWDQPHHASESWRQEFRAEHLDGVLTSLELGTGPPASRILEVAENEAVDGIAMAWSQDFSKGHADTVREVLAGTRVPVTLVPISPPLPGPEGFERNEDVSDLLTPHR